MQPLLLWVMRSGDAGEQRRSVGVTLQADSGLLQAKNRVWRRLPFLDAVRHYVALLTPVPRKLDPQNFRSAPRGVAVERENGYLYGLSELN